MAGCSISTLDDVRLTPLTLYGIPAFDVAMLPGPCTGGAYGLIPAAIRLYG